MSKPVEIGKVYEVWGETSDLISDKVIATVTTANPWVDVRLKSRTTALHLKAKVFDESLHNPVKRASSI